MGSEVLDKRDLLVGERTNFLAIHGDCTNQSVLLEHWHDEKGSGATLINERDDRRKTRLVSSFLREVRDMNTLLRCRNARQGNVRQIGPDNQRLPPPTFDICWLTMPRDRAKGLCLTKEKIAKLRFANMRGTAQHCSEHRLKVARRA